MPTNRKPPQRGPSQFEKDQILEMARRLGELLGQTPGTSILPPIKK
jgi:hypothetical protein